MAGFGPAAKLGLGDHGRSPTFRFEENTCQAPRLIGMSRDKEGNPLLNSLHVPLDPQSCSTTHPNPHRPLPQFSIAAQPPPPSTTPTKVALPNLNSAPNPKNPSATPPVLALSYKTHREPGGMLPNRNNTVRKHGKHALSDPQSCSSGSPSPHLSPVMPLPKGASPVSDQSTTEGHKPAVPVTRV